MIDRVKRLQKLIDVHATLEALSEARRAGHLARAQALRDEAKTLAERLDDAHSLSVLFPALFHRRIQAALAEAGEADADAAREAEALARLRLRAKNIRRARDAAKAEVERGQAERLVLDWVEARQARPSSRGQTER